MNKKLTSKLSIFAVAFALLLGFGTINNASAVPGMGGDAYNLPEGETNLFASDIDGGRPDVVFHRDADAMTVFETDSYGLLLKSQQ